MQCTNTTIAAKSPRFNLHAFCNVSPHTTGNNLEDIGGSVIVSALEEPTLALAELWLWDCGIGVATAKAFGTALGKNQVLQVRHAQLVRYVCEGSNIQPQLRLLLHTVPYPPPPHTHTHTFVTLSFFSSFLISLSLSLSLSPDCKLPGPCTNHQLCHYTDGVTTHHQIANFRGHAFGDEGGSAVVDGLGTNSSLEELRLCRCGLGM
jgi:hypothetical protein